MIILWALLSVAPDHVARYDGDAIVPPAALTAESRPPLEAKQGVIFVNFDGADIQPGDWNTESSRTNVSWLAASYPVLAGPYPPFGNGAKRDAALQAVKLDWQAFNVVVTDQRPASGDYTMNMTGPKSLGGSILGIAPVDCYDSSTHNNVSYAFHSAGDGYSASVVATTVSQEVAHSFGLEHVSDPADIMNPSNDGGDARFKDQCIPLNGNISCWDQHAANCAGGQQNSHQDLLDLFGLAVPDAQAPSTEITHPADGDAFAIGANFEIKADASDDVGVREVRLYVNGEMVGVDGSAPYGWGVADIPAGDYELQAVAVDDALNENVSETVDIAVGNHPGGGSSGGDDDGALPPGYGDLVEERDAGCGCSGATPINGRLAQLVMLLVLIRRLRQPEADSR